MADPAALRMLAQVQADIAQMREDRPRQRRDGAKFLNRLDADQGFVDQHGKFMGRHEAYTVAMLAGQIVYPAACGQDLDGPKLYSEGLY